jgi:hypothetical protein
MQKPNAVVNQDVGSELCLIEGHGMARRRWQPVAGKLQKSQRALHALVMAKWHRPGPPSQTARSAIFQIEGRFGVSFPISSSPQLRWARFLTDLHRPSRGHTFVAH